MNQIELPTGGPVVPEMVQAVIETVAEPPKFRTYTELEMQDIRRKLIENNGDLAAAGITLEQMRDVIYTCRMKANPMQEAQETEGAPKPARAPRAPKTPAVKTKLSGDDVADFLG
jgi:hypothetical protein